MNQEAEQKPADYYTKGGTIPHGTKLRGKYSGKEFSAEIHDGQVVMRNQRYSSLSKAAVAAKRSTGANIVTSNGWRFWERQDPKDGKWRPCADVRNRARN